MTERSWRWFGWFRKSREDGVTPHPAQPPPPLNCDINCECCGEHPEDCDCDDPEFYCQYCDIMVSEVGECEENVDDDDGDSLYEECPTIRTMGDIIADTRKHGLHN